MDSTIKSLNYTNRAVLLGDMLECATKTSIGAGMIETNMTPKQQRDYLIAKLDPVKEFIDGAVPGNHEARIYEMTSFNPLEDACRILGIPYLGYTGFVKYSFEKHSYVMRIWHGAGGGSTAQTAINCAEKMGQRSLADINVIGHFHKKIKSDRIIKIPDLRNMKVIKMNQHFVCNGSALGFDDGYAEMKDLDERDLGFVTIQLSGVRNKKEVKVIL